MNWTLLENGIFVCFEHFLQCYVLFHIKCVSVQDPRRQKRGVMMKNMKTARGLKSDVHPKQRRRRL